MTISMTAAPALLDVVAAVAESLADPAIVRRHPDQRTDPQALGGGAAGIALLHIERAATGHGDERVAHTWLQAVAAEPVSAGPNANLFNGAPAFGLVLHCAATTTTRYRGALAALDQQTTMITLRRIEAAHARMDRGEPLAMREFDLVHGLTGLGLYHLLRHPDAPVTRRVFEYLVRITIPLADRPTVRPPWWLSTGLNGNPSAQMPDGHGNLGVSHGVSAVIALLARAAARNMAVPGMNEAVATLCSWIDQWQQTDATATSWWPGYITADNNDSGKVTAAQRPRPSWCYGVTGIAQAQHLAGGMLADHTRQQTARDALLGALRDPVQRALLPDIGLCHGKAGLLQATWRMAHTRTDAALAAHLPRLAADLADQLTGPIGDPELMDGAAGAALAVHTTAIGQAPTTGWDAFLLLTD